METDKKYTITLNEKQLKVLNKALDLHSRLICGQLDMAVEPFIEKAYIKRMKSEGKNDSDAYNSWFNVMEGIKIHLKELKMIGWNMPENGDYGVRYDNDSDILYDMHQVIRHQLWREKDKDKRSDYTVDASVPMMFGSEPPIEIERKQ